MLSCQQNKYYLYILVLTYQLFDVNICLQVSKSEVIIITDKERQILDNIKKSLPHLSESKKERLLGFSEGLLYKSEQLGKETTNK